ncbi:MAG: MtnX-like HAD-IB family phosphatase [Armatimonadota bacterium]
MTQPQQDTHTHLARNDLVFIDFDGTITKVDTGIAVINALDLDEAWEVENEWRAGKIDSMECLSRQWGMVDLKPRHVYKLIDSLRVDEDFNWLAEGAVKIGAGLVVVSDGLDFYIKRILGAMGWSICDGEKAVEKPDDCIPVFANKARVSDDGIEIEFPYVNDECRQCGNCKRSHLHNLRPHFNQVIYIGDGHSDMCAAREADVIFAKSHLADDLEKDGHEFIRFETLEDVCNVLFAPYMS